MNGRVILVSLLLIACTRQDPPVESVINGPDATPLTVGDEPGELSVAELASFIKRVTFRRRQSLTWDEAARLLPLFSLDAVRTHAAATAEIEFKNGSDIHMREHSLVIINLSARGPDRALVRTGRLDAKTKRQLWLLTSAALLTIKPKSSGAQAKATLELEEGKKLSLTLKEGWGAWFPSRTLGTVAVKDGKILNTGKTVSLAAPAATERFGFDKEVAWPTEPELEEASRELTSISPAVKPDFQILSPADSSEVITKWVDVRGTVTTKDASLFVNGKQVKVNARMEFSTRVTLSLGVNPILVQLNPRQGAPISKRWMVTRTK